MERDARNSGIGERDRGGLLLWGCRGSAIVGRLRRPPRRVHRGGIPVTIGLRRLSLVPTLSLAISLAAVGPALAEDVNCANEFRSGKLYFSQKLYDKAVQRFGVAAGACPDKAEYRARYAMALA